LSIDAGRSPAGSYSTPKIILALALCCLGCAIPAVSFAREAEVRGVFRSNNLYNTDLGATVLDGRLDAEVEFGPYILGGTWRGYHLSDETYNPRGIEYPQPRIKHRYAEVRIDSLGSCLVGDGCPLGSGSLLVRLGDCYATFGRGLALRSFEDIDLERDTALDGILGEYDLGCFKVTALSGELDERISATLRNRHQASGARVAVAREGLLVAAASAVGRHTERRDAQLELPDSLRNFDDRVLGGEAEVWLGPLQVAADYAQRQGDYYPTLSQGDIAGHGGYLSATVATAWLTLVGEYKDYRRFADALSNPPTCVMEHTSTLANRVTHEVDFNDERGFLVQGNLAIIDGVPITAGASEARRDGGDLAHWEIFGNLGAPVGGSAGITLEASWSREYAAGKFTEHLTGMLDAELAGGESGIPMEFGVGAQAIEEPSGEAYANYLATGAWYVTPAVTLSAVAEATSQDGLERSHWLAGEIGIALAEGLDVSVGFGTERGGKKCSGGVCYTEPEFAGVRLRLMKSF